MKSKRYLKYAANMLMSRASGKPHLRLVFAYPTYRCNLNCIYCENPQIKRDEHSAREWKGVFAQMAALGSWRVTLLGGEPLIRRDIADIIQHVRDLDMKCVLTSNGLLVPARIDELHELDTLVLSLDAASETTDELRGKGVFKAVREAVKAAKDAGISVKINAVLSSKTSPLLEDTLSFLERNEIGATFNILRTGPERLKDKIAALRDSEEGIRAVLNTLAARAINNPHILFSPHTFRKSALWPDYSRNMYSAEEISPDDAVLSRWPQCRAGRYYMTIDPCGAGFPCVLNAEKIDGGNVFKDGVETCWRNLHSHTCAACYAPCLVELNQLFSMSPPIITRFLKRYMARYL